jgi:ankyrin repeat protein
MAMSPIDELILTIVRGDIAGVRAMLAADAELATQSNFMGTQPIHAARYCRHDGIALLLAEHVELTGHVAAELALTEEVHQLMHEEPGFIHSMRDGRTPLHGACYWGAVEIVDLLLSHGADPNVPTQDGFLDIRPLGTAVATPDIPNPSWDEAIVVTLIDLLLSAGADVNGRRRDGMTALHTAAWRGHLTVIERLIVAGANPSIRGYGDGGRHAGQSPLDLALAQGQEDAADLLRALGASS